ncbi:hypothetical protein [Leptothoe spongobia]|uniref:Uncharacterized protein n=1 Tax=Leptothoe spongobia TAU-MAC 1115 TaxID=1967444 RepID=A0A947DHA6_9CYAN|nr:hypothetical protein [Leptothoe spongobia]MBT9316891.1 hypothetical protein [Leptothoe spongobia TAU-MAC 1115]
MDEEHGNDPEALFLGDDHTGKPLMPNENDNPNSGIDMDEEQGTDPDSLFPVDDLTGNLLMSEKNANPNADLTPSDLELSKGSLADNALNGSVSNYDYLELMPSLGASYLGDTPSSFDVLPGLDSVANNGWVATTHFAVAAPNFTV